MDLKPQLLHRPTSITLGGEVGSCEKGASPGPSEKVPDNLPKHKSSSKGPTSQSAWESSPVDRRIYDISLLIMIILMVSWPWIFWGVVFHVKGVQMNDHLAGVVADHPHSTNFFVTLVGNLVCLVVDILFSFSVIRFAQEWMASADEVTVFHVSLLYAFRHQTWPWGLEDLGTILRRNRWLPVTLAAACIAAFTFVPSSTTSLLGPVPFNKTVSLVGTELDLSSTATECVQFLNDHPFSNNCDWREHKGFPYTSCLGQNQLVDVLESGRGNVLSLLPNNSQSLTFSQLGNEGGLHFLGPLRGILPMGPNGAPAFDTLRPSPVSDLKARAAMLSYNYTLEHQGLSSNVTCIYDTASPVRFGQVVPETNLALQFNGTCEGQVDILNSNNVRTFVSVNGNNSLGYWACKSPPDPQQDQSYYVYLRGRANYTESIGNITCTISPIKTAVFPITYQSQPRIFSVKEPVSIGSATYHRLIEYALVALGGIVQESQNWEANLVAESVITFAVKSFGLKPYERTPDHLRLYGAMIQGMLEYESAYIRLIYSTVENPPASCIRAVEGTATYEVMGWFAEIEHIGFLVPMTLINLSSLGIIVAVLVMAKGRAYIFNPLSTGSLLAANTPEDKKPHKLDDPVIYLDPKKAAGDALERNSQGILDTVRDFLSPGCFKTQ